MELSGDGALRGSLQELPSDLEGDAAEQVGILTASSPSSSSGCSRGPGLRWVAAATTALSALAFGAVALKHGHRAAGAGQRALGGEPPSLAVLDLNEDSSRSTTSVPFRMSSKDLPSLFCWLVSQTVGGPELNRHQGWWEENLVSEMLTSKVGIFACNEFTVFTDKKCIVNQMGRWGWPYVEEDYVPRPGEIVSWSLQRSTTTAKNSDTSPSNSWVFTAAWKALGNSGVLDKHHWVVKQDPDACFFPWRLRWHASQYPGKDGLVPVYIKNCQPFNSMQGPLEIFSIAMVKAILPNIDYCGNDAAGEDGKMEKCAKEHGGQEYMDVAALKDQYCLHMQPDCHDGNTLAFHPFKVVPGFRECVQQSMAAEDRYTEAAHPK
uniref:Uncharacterized protein n=1 Tax=Alexandrium andersonii TaxID=327968 RepID=A0A7S2DTL0_9DINO